MLTIESLKDFGANTQEGLARCINNEQLYLKLVKKAVETGTAQQLRQALADGDMEKAFELCHSMKGVMGNLSLTPIYQPASELTELLRAKQPGDYGAYLSAIEDGFNKLKALCE